MRIQHNIMAMNAYRNYNNNTSALSKNLEKLSSGYKINRAGDDAAGLAISEKMRAQITGLDAAQKNVKDGISLVKTGEGAMQEIHDMLNRMDYLATQSANGTYDDEVDRWNLQKEVNALKSEINRIADSANFNGIKLLDGSLSTANLTAKGMETSTIDMAKGVEVTQGTTGGGSFGEYTINVSKAFGDGDQLTINFGGKKTTPLVLSYNTTAGATNFSGETLEKQAESIANALRQDTDVAQNFNISVDGTTVKLTSLVEGNDTNATLADGSANPMQTSVVTNVTVTNKDAKQDTGWKETQAAADNGTLGSVKFEKLLDNSAAGDANAWNIKDGDVLTFEVTTNAGDDNEAKLTMQLTAGKDFKVGPAASDTATSLTTALNTVARFSDNGDTVIDESQIKFSDMFTASADGGTLKLTNKTSFAGTGTDVKITSSTGKTMTSAQDVAPVTAAGKAAIYTLALTPADAQNLALGDKLTIKGELGDGRTFEFDVEAGKDFKVGDDLDGTMANIKELLETKGMDVDLKNATGKAAGTVSSTEIFGDDKEISISDTAHTFTSNKVGTVLNSAITEVKLTTGGAAKVAANLKNGDQQSSADSIIDFSEGLEYGASIKVGDKTYEIVKNENDVSSAKNVAVVVDDPSDTTAAAKAMVKALENELDSDIYEVSSSGSKVTISTVEVGSEANAIEVSASGDKTKQIEFTFDPAKMKSGSSVTINGQKYEFVEKGGTTSEAGVTKIEVDNFKKATANSLGNALAAVANGVNNASVRVDENGLVTVRGMLDKEGTMVDPSVKFANGTGGLKLQIGDTADDFNQMSVSIYNMHVADMGIGDIDISTQEGAQASIDQIKSAINYVSDVRGDLGAIQNRLEHTGNNLSVMAENIQDAESTIRDTDVAAEMMSYVKNNILVQSAQAMLAQANQVPQGVLQLLG